jgi:hypothetical protein
MINKRLPQLRPQIKPNEDITSARTELYERDSFDKSFLNYNNTEIRLAIQKNDQKNTGHRSTNDLTIIGKRSRANNPYSACGHLSGSN